MNGEAGNVCCDMYHPFGIKNRNIPHIRPPLTGGNTLIPVSGEWNQNYDQLALIL